MDLTEKYRGLLLTVNWAGRARERCAPWIWTLLDAVDEHGVSGEQLASVLTRPVKTGLLPHTIGRAVDVDQHARELLSRV